MRRIEHLLRERIGLDAATIGVTAVQRAVRLRVKILGLKRIEDYERLLAASGKEWAELVETVVVTETWFFRDRAPFAALARLVIEEWLLTHRTRPLRLLSLPCSSGEEPYSIAMALTEAGVPNDRFQIDAVDISAHALARAKRGVYGKNSFRGRDLAFRTRYFQQTKEGFVLSPAIRDRVHFFCANLLGEGFPTNRAQYDVIFCRNLLIYLDRPGQAKALQKVMGLLEPSGVLFVGAAEQPLVIGQGFVSAELPMAFACRRPCARAALVGRHDLRPKLAKAPRSPGNPPHLHGVQTSAGRDGEARPSDGNRPLASGQPSLEHARELADTGRLVEATAICEAHLRENRTSAQAWYLLGLVRDAGGDGDATDYYRKALYLDPCHYDSLLRMALLAQKNGDLAGSRNFKRRAERARASVQVNGE